MGNSDWKVGGLEFEEQGLLGTGIEESTESEVGAGAGFGE